MFGVGGLLVVGGPVYDGQLYTAGCDAAAAYALRWGSEVLRCETALARKNLRGLGSWSCWRLRTSVVGPNVVSYDRQSASAKEACGVS